MACASSTTLFHCIFNVSTLYLSQMMNNLASSGEFRVFLDRLKPLLDNLPQQLPIKNATDSAFTSFLNFQIDPELLERTGCEVSTLSEQLRSTGDGVSRLMSEVLRCLLCTKYSPNFGNTTHQQKSYLLFLLILL